MKKFSFPLQSVLDYYRRLEAIEEARLNQLLKEKHDLGAALHEAQRSCRRFELELQEKKEIFPNEFLLYGRYISHLQARIHSLTLQGRQLESLIEKQRSVLVAATQRRKVVDRLRERKEEIHNQEVDRLLQQEADDLHLQRRSR